MKTKTKRLSFRIAVLAVLVLAMVALSVTLTVGMTFNVRATATTGGYVVGAQTYNTFNDAYAPCLGNNKTMNINEDTTEDGEMTIGSGDNITVEIADGKTWTITGNLTIVQAITIKGGTLDVKGGSGITVSGPNATLNTNTKSNITVNNTCTIAGGVHTGIITASPANLTITGGTFSQDPTQYVDQSTYMVSKGDGTWTVSEQPETESIYTVNGQGFDTFDAAYAVAKPLGDNGRIIVHKNTPVEPNGDINDGVTVEILEGATLTFKDTLNLNRNTICGNGTLTFAEGDLGTRGVVLWNELDLLLKDITITNGRVGVGSKKKVFENVTMSRPDGDYEIFYVNGGCDLTINGGNYTGKMTIQPNATLVITGGTFNTALTGTGVTENTANITVTGGTFVQDPSNWIDRDMYEAKDESGNGSGPWTVVKKEYNDYYSYAGGSAKTLTEAINDGNRTDKTITLLHSVEESIGAINSDVILNVDEGLELSIANNVDIGSNATLTGKGKISVNGGITFVSNANLDDGINVETTTGMTVAGTSTVNFNNLVTSSNVTVAGAESTLNITDGVYDGNIYHNAGTVSISGGKFKNKPDDTLLAADYYFEGPGADGYYIVSKQGESQVKKFYKVDETEYATFKQAYDAAKADGQHGKTIEVTASNEGQESGFDISYVTIQINPEVELTFSGTLNIWEEMTITGGGTLKSDVVTHHPNTVIENITLANGYRIGLQGSSDVTFKNVTMGAGTAGDSFYINGGKATVESGTFSGNLTIQYSTTLVVKNGTVTGTVNVNSSANAEISGGAFTNFKVNDTATATITGGTFDALSVAEGATCVISGGTFKTDPSAYVADGCTVEKDEAAGTWTVKKAFEVYTLSEGSYVLKGSYDNLQAAINAAVKGDVIVLNADVKASETTYTFPAANAGIALTALDINGDKDSITIDTNGHVLFPDESNVTVVVPAGTNIVFQNKGGAEQLAINGQLTANGGKYVNVQNNGTLTVNNGSEVDKVENNNVLTVNKGGNAGDVTNAADKTTTVNGGTVANVTGGTLTLGEADGTAATVTGNVNVNTFNMTNGNVEGSLTITENGGMTVSGGTVKGDVTVPEGLDTKNVTGGSYGDKEFFDKVYPAAEIAEDQVTVVKDGIYSVKSIDELGEGDEHTVTEGTLTKAIDQKYIAAGRAIMKSATEEKWTICDIKDWLGSKRNDLEGIFTGVIQNGDYSEAGQKAIKEIYDAAAAYMANDNAANLTMDLVDAKITEAQTAMEAVPDKAAELAQAKADAKEELVKYMTDKNLTDDQKSALTTEQNAKIDEAADTAAVDAALTAAKAAVDLRVAKNDAIADLEKYAGDLKVDLADQSVADGKTAIDAAADQAGIDAAVAAAEKAIDEKALANEKVAAVNGLKGYATEKGVAEDDESVKNGEKAINDVTIGEGGVKAAIDAVQSALTDAKAAVDAKALANKKAAAKETLASFAEGKNLTEEQKATLIADGEKAIDEAKDEASVDTALSAAEAAITLRSDKNDAIAALEQKANENGVATDDPIIVAAKEAIEAADSKEAADKVVTDNEAAIVLQGEKNTAIKALDTYATDRGVDTDNEEVKAAIAAGKEAIQNAADSAAVTTQSDTAKINISKQGAIAAIKAYAAANGVSEKDVSVTDAIAAIEAAAAEGDVETIETAIDGAVSDGEANIDTAAAAIADAKEAAIAELEDYAKTMGISLSSELYLNCLANINAAGTVDDVTTALDDAKAAIDNAIAVAAAKEAAKMELNIYAASNGLSPYDDLSVAGAAAIDAADTLEGVAAALKEAEQAIYDAVNAVDDEALLAAAKADAVNELRLYAASLKVSVSDPAVVAGVAAINSAADEDGIKSALADAKVAIKAVADRALAAADAAELAEAIDTAMNTLTIYANTQGVALSGEMATYVSAIKAATDFASVEDALAAAIKKVDEIKANVEDTAEKDAELAIAKEEAVRELKLYAVSCGVAFDDDSVKNGLKAINEASDRAGVATALSSAKTTVYNVSIADNGERPVSAGTILVIIFGAVVLVMIIAAIGMLIGAARKKKD